MNDAPATSRAVPTCVRYGVPAAFIASRSVGQAYLRMLLPAPDTNAQPLLTVMPPTCDSAIATTPTVEPVAGSMP